MDETTRLLLVLGVITLASILGLLWKTTQGRAKRIREGLQVDLAELGATKKGVPVTAFGDRITFLQFSSEFCSTCKSTARIFEELENTSEDVLHIEVDITNRLDLANKFNILQTPTTLVLDKRGIVQSRIGGAPKQNTLDTQLGTFVI
jgi:thiol-disulfide isomerase/thioredoxin